VDELTMTQSVAAVGGRMGAECWRWTTTESRRKSLSVDAWVSDSKPALWRDGYVSAGVSIVRRWKCFAGAWRGRRAALNKPRITMVICLCVHARCFTTGTANSSRLMSETTFSGYTIFIFALTTDFIREF